MKTFLKKNIYIILFVIYIASIITLLVIPVSNLTKIKIASRLPIRADYLMHGLMFFPWAFFMFSFKRIKGWIWMSLGILLGTFMELVQYFLNYRSFSYQDIIADGIGLLSGLIIVLLIRIIIQKTKK
ncbi:VanZ family protein [Bacteroidales bacterium OttesenSCG-928-K03]|nr:VanZ family protein [Odoribacter sp. OttesenSCG-928-L07]MDL2240824.1 VanZ family protein [Bacteroidales bacterium OttesenSCG-928-K22]MDL2242394.1 VanZ family protein [Bacteroidales bacterium OttesenSCG-928-K03]